MISARANLASYGSGQGSLPDTRGAAHQPFYEQTILIDAGVLVAAYYGSRGTVLLARGRSSTCPLWKLPDFRVVIGHIGVAGPICANKANLAAAIGAVGGFGNFILVHVERDLRTIGNHG